MELIKQKYHYKSFGLKIESEIFFPELNSYDNLIDCDVTIKISNLSNIWIDLSKSDSLINIRKNFIIFKVPHVATFCIRGGNTIIVDSLDKVDEGLIRLYVLGSCMGAILMQRKILPLHGSAIEINGKAYAIVGHSGAGKSTLASAFLKNGFRLLSDDIIPVAYENNIPVVIPSYPQQKLWQQSLIEFEMNYENYSPLFERENKYAVPITNFTLDTIPIAGVFELIKTKEDEIQFHQVEGVNRLRTLFQHTYRKSYLPKLELVDWHFKECVRLINKVQIAQLYRPHTPFTANQLVNVILDSIYQKEEVTC
jgi:hypothetical protein